MSEPNPTVEEREQPSEEQRSPGAQAPGGEAPADRRAAEEQSAESAAPTERSAQAEDSGDAAEIESDLDELISTVAQRDEYLALAQRTQADFENYRKRVAREAAAALARGASALAKDLLPALDNLDRALEKAGTAAGGAAEDDPLLEGVRLVRSELAAALARAGIESFSPLGEVFDPALHEAVATAEQPADGLPSGAVVEVYQPGYRLGASIIRPARVLVAA